MHAVIFDLDDTLLDTSALRAEREARDWRSVYSRLDEVRPFAVPRGQPAVTDLPALVRERGNAVGLLTHSPARYARELLAAHSIAVDAMVSGSDGYPPKPDPTGLKALLAELGVDAGDALYVGDSVGDFGAAAASGTRAAGVAWSQRPSSAWRHGWPDMATCRPTRLLRYIGGDEGLAPWAEASADGATPDPHWGSLMRLGDSVFGMGRYFPTTDRRYPGHSLSHLVLRAKDDEATSDEVAEIFASLAEEATTGPVPELILSVPPDPHGDGFDRFSAARAALSTVYGARDGAGLLSMRYGDSDYKHVHRDDRPARNVDRFSCAPLSGESSLLIDDVLTSGGQSEACRAAIAAAGGGPTAVLVLAVTQDRLPEPCPLCGANLKTFARHSDGHEFLGCSAWRATGCPYTRNL